ncbi:MAG: uroporphyrinogen decarboxylase [Verrucomicrobiae bacterium]|nr:uroporphyrinogen decarboxylase [Verrucomicrobiae bacterium]MDW7980664.1 uroporphyrinogen decarboxylase family protein [Verrucomicrobiales bacterium]
MTDSQWEQLLAVLRGERVEPLPVGFIIDSPWLPNWFGIDIINYLSNETAWLEANRRAVETFPEVWFMPGFWAEFGMCTEPSAFGACCVFQRNEFPFPKKNIRDISQLADFEWPDPATHGLLPFVIERLKWAQPHIEALGHKIRFSVSRGPLNVASFLMGMTEFLMALKTEPEAVHKLLSGITQFLQQWHQLQRSVFPSIDGMLVLDDVVGFMREADFMEFAYPYLKQLFAADVSVKFFHNDAPCAQSVRHYAAIGINLYNPGPQTPLNELRKLAGDGLTLMGNIPPRDVLAQGTPETIRKAVAAMLRETTDHTRLIVSCGGGMPPGTSTENIRAFIEAVRSYSS